MSRGGFWPVSVFGLSGEGHAGAEGDYRPVAVFRPQHPAGVSFRSTAVIQRFVTAGKSLPDRYRLRTRVGPFWKAYLCSIGSVVAVRGYCLYTVATCPRIAPSPR